MWKLILQTKSLPTILSEILIAQAQARAFTEIMLYSPAMVQEVISYTGCQGNQKAWAWLTSHIEGPMKAILQLMNKVMVVHSVTGKMLHYTALGRATKARFVRLAGRNWTHAVQVRVIGHSFHLCPTTLRGWFISLHYMVFKLAEVCIWLFSF